jgi:glycosyltransferase involved in cell wall biosynthesis
MTPTRIFYIIDTLGAGGAERQLVYLLEHLDRTHFDPAVVTLYDNTYMPYHYADALQALNIPIYTLSHGRGWRGRVEALARYVRLMWQWRPAIVHSYLHYANLIARAARVFCPPHRLITAVRTRYSDTELRTEHLTAWLSDHIVANGDHVAKRVIEGAKLPTKKVSVIVNAIPLHQFAQNSQPLLRAELFREARFVAVMVARIDPRKDHMTLLKAVSLMQNREGFKLFLIGDVTFLETVREIQAFIERHDLQPFIVHHGATSDVSPYYHAADISLLTSSTEAFPNVILESFAAGKPMIVSSAANAIQLVADGLTGWEFPTGDAAALARCLDKAQVAPREQLREMGEAAKVVAAGYDVGEMTNSYMALYRRLLGKA